MTSVPRGLYSRGGYCLRLYNEDLNYWNPFKELAFNGRFDELTFDFIELDFFLNIKKRCRCYLKNLKVFDNVLISESTNTLIFTLYFISCYNSNPDELSTLFCIFISCDSGLEIIILMVFSRLWVLL